MLRARRLLARVVHGRKRDPARDLTRSRKKVVVSAGMMRSGSTWLFNALRLLLQAADEPVYAFWINDWQPREARGARYLLVKLHEANERLGDAPWRCYTCHRDLRDVAVSLRDMGLAEDGDDQLRAVREARDGYDFWARRANLDIAYQSIVDDAPGVLTSLAADLGIDVSHEDLVSIAASLSSMEAGAIPAEAPYDPLTLLHSEHRFDGRPGRYLDSLDPQTEKAIVDAHGDWLTSHGYL
jgi:hypothetical protein